MTLQEGHIPYVYNGATTILGNSVYIVVEVLPSGNYDSSLWYEHTLTSSKPDAVVQSAMTARVEHKHGTRLLFLRAE